MIGCIEAGGTKFMLGVTDGAHRFLRTTRVETAEALPTIDRAIGFFEEARADLGDYTAIGIASFGPVGIDRRRSDWGHILSTPKPGWSGVDLAGAFGGRFACPVSFDSDVNGAALAETLWGASQGASTAVYVTVGTGIGGGVVINGVPVHGLRHPEVGHIRVARHAHDRDFAGSCPFHGDCLEGLASGTAIKARWGMSLSELPKDHPAHEIVADYLAQLVIAQQAIISPERYVFGGGVMATDGLIERVRTKADELDGGYFGVADYATRIVPPALGDHAGLLGALALVQREFHSQQKADA